MIEVEVCYAERDRAVRIAVTLPADAKVADAIDASRIAAAITPDPASLGLAVFGRRANPDTTLVDGDRVELLRPLVVDPKEARRRRAAKKASIRRPGDEPATCSTAPPVPAAC